MGDAVGRGVILDFCMDFGGWEAPLEGEVGTFATLEVICYGGQSLPHPPILLAIGLAWLSAFAQGREYGRSR